MRQVEVLEHPPQHLHHHQQQAEEEEDDDDGGGGNYWRREGEAHLLIIPLDQEPLNPVVPLDFPVVYPTPSSLPYSSSPSIRPLLLSQMIL